MNVIKFEDTISGNEYFDQTFKGKYAYVINWVWVHPMTEDFNDYAYRSMSVFLQNNPDRAEECGVIKLEDIADGLIDWPETARINSTTQYLLSNKYTTTPDMDIATVKRFRTILAQSLWDFNHLQTYSVFDEKTSRMVHYYAQNMNDEVTKGLYAMLGLSYVPLPATQPVTSSACGCGSIIAQPITGTGTCDSVTNYKLMMTHVMVEAFRSIEFWVGKEEICKDIVVYLRNIITTNLPLTTQTDTISCGTINVDYQKQNQQKLHEAITAFEYIINGEIAGNKNFISQSLLSFALMYETLQW